MAKGQPKHVIPKIVRWVDEALSEKLGRPAFARQVKNGDTWWVNDPAFSYLQVGHRAGTTDYRVGFMITLEPASISFAMLHTPALAKLFRSNVDFELIIDAFDRTQLFRREHYLHYSSKREVRRGSRIACIESSDYASFRSALLTSRKNLVQDLFPMLPNQGRGVGKAKKAGNDFLACLADRATLLALKRNVQQIVHEAWPLFCCLYPAAAPRRRDAILAAKLKTACIEQRCEFKDIKLWRKVRADPGCDGRIEGAHIKPDALGGTDEVENGLWLCRYHHIATEGLLRGRRGNVYAVVA